MSRFLAALLMLNLMAAAPAMAADEEEPAPSIGGPIVTIPVDAGQVSSLVVNNVVLEPSQGLMAGDVVRFTGTIATGVAPPRAVLKIEGFREIDPNLPVAADGSIDHSFTIPDDLAPGSYELTLRAEALGVAPLGRLDIEPSPATTVASETELDAEPGVESVEPTVAQEEEAAPAALDEPGPASGFGWAVPLALLLVVAAGVLLAIGLRRRRAGEVPTVSRTASLPTATHVLARETDADADVAEVSEVARLETAEPQGTIDELPEDPVDVDAVVAVNEAPEPQADEQVGVDDRIEGPVAAAADPEPEAATPPVVAVPRNFVVVELTEMVAGSGDGDERERIIGEFPTAAEAKEAARAARSTNDVKPPQEVWWEVRPGAGSAIWMIHAWAPREYDLDTRSGEARSAPTT